MAPLEYRRKEWDKPHQISNPFYEKITARKFHPRKSTLVRKLKAEDEINQIPLLFF